MKIRFWGVRGSTPVPEMDKMKVGGNTSCVELIIDEYRRIIFDGGSGIRGLGGMIAKEISEGKSKNVRIILSHTHWDHIQGFVFFAPMFIQGVNIQIIGPKRANRKLSHLVSGQMEYDYWPIKLSQLPSSISIEEWDEGEYKLWDDVKIIARRHIHPGTAFGYRVDHNGKSITYCTDTEHFQNMVDQRVTELAHKTDLLIHDAQYVDEEMEFKLGWGHSSWQQAIRVADEAEAKTLVLFHHDPSRKDEDAFDIEKKAQATRPDTLLAKEGLTIDI